MPYKTDYTGCPIWEAAARGWTPERALENRMAVNLLTEQEFDRLYGCHGKNIGIG